MGKITKNNQNSKPLNENKNTNREKLKTIQKHSKIARPTSFKNNNSKVQRLKIIRRTPGKKPDFKSKPKTLKHSKHAEKSQNKKQRTNIKEEEDQIILIEKENKMLQDTGFYTIKKEEELVNQEEDWDNNTEGEKLVNLHDLLTSKMNEVDDNSLDNKVVQGFKDLGDILSKWTSGKLPKLFGILPSLEQWREYIVFSNPRNWTPHAMYEGTCMFASNLNNTLAEVFFRDFLVPNIRDRIRKDEKLNLYLYNALKKAIFKPAGFFKGIIFPMAENLTAKEANIIGSILKKCSIPIAHSSSAIIKLAELNGYDRVSHGHFFFMKLLLSKKYALPTPVKVGLVEFLVNLSKSKKFISGILPVLFHQVLLIFVQIYKFDLTDDERKILRQLCNKFAHHTITDLVLKEINFKQ